MGSSVVLMKQLNHGMCSLLADHGVLLLLIFGEKLISHIDSEKKFACDAGETLEL